MANKFKISNLNRGMTYVELIVVLSIFSVMSSVVIFNYGDFQAKIEVKNLASDVALKVVEAQKSSLSGLLPPGSLSQWKPSYGVYFNLSEDNNKKFLYFADLDNGLRFNGTDCTGECLSKIFITKNNFISDLTVFYTSLPPSSVSNLTVSFVRPDSSARIVSGSTELTGVSYVRITITSPKGAEALIKLYPSGRIETN